MELGRDAVVAAIGAGDLPGAEVLCRQLAAAGAAGEAAYLLAVIRNAQDRLPEALALAGDAAALLPDRGDVAYNRGVILRRAGHLAEAVGEWVRALDLIPTHQGAAFNLACALAEAGRADDAAAIYRALLALAPGHRDAAFNLGNLLHRLRRLDEAETVFAELCARHPGFAAGWINRGQTLQEAERPEQAETCYRAALAADPADVQAHWHLALLLLATGRWREGLEAFEWRLRLPDIPRPGFPWPAWHPGFRPGARVVLWNDQGRGDAIQFFRYAPLLAERGFRVSLWVQSDLRRLAAAVPGVEAAFGSGDPLPEFDAHAPLLSLPLLLGEDRPAGGRPVPYLPAGGRAADRRPGRRAVGLVWAGNPAHDNDANRSLPLAALAPLFELDGIDWVALQVGRAAEQRADSPWAGLIRDAGSGLSDFADTAQVIGSLDLVITVDTAAAHLAGALGAPVWVLLPRVGVDWRWGHQGESTAWYPTMRLFRQVAAGDWSGPVAVMRAALDAGCVSLPS